MRTRDACGPSKSAAMEKASAKEESSEATSKSRNEAAELKSELHPVLWFQSAIGNQAVQRLLSDHVIQPKLAVSQPSDPYEVEADRISESISKISAQPSSSPCACGGTCSSCK